MVPLSFWRRAIRELSKIKPLFFLAEGEAPELHDSGFHMTYASRMYHLFNRIAAGTAPADEILSLLEEERDAYPVGALRMRFTSNHDENFWKGPAIERLGIEGAKAFAVLTFTLPGHPLIYNGQEIGLGKRLPFFEKDSIEWRESAFEPLYQRCIQLYKRHPALRKGRLLPLTGTPLLAFKKERGRDRIIALFNLTPGRVQTRIKLDGLSGHFIEAFRATRLTVDDSELHFELPPWGYRIYLSETTAHASGSDTGT
jgi:glycosidase